MSLKISVKKKTNLRVTSFNSQKKSSKNQIIINIHTNFYYYLVINNLVPYSLNMKYITGQRTAQDLVIFKWFLRNRTLLSHRLGSCLIRITVIQQTEKMIKYVGHEFLSSTAAQRALRSSLSLNIVKRGVVEEVGSIEASKRWTVGPLLIPASQIDSPVRPPDHMMDVSTTQSASLLSPLVTQVRVCTFPSFIQVDTHQRTPVTILKSHMWHWEREKCFIHDSNTETAWRCGFRPMTAGVTNYCTALLQDVSIGKVHFVSL